MKLKDGRTITNFSVPKFFDNCISVSYCGREEPEEIEILNLAISLVVQTAEKSFPSLPVLPLNIYFLESNSLTFTLDNSILGCFHPIIVFPVELWRTAGLSKDKILFIMVEELCHAIWQIPDGPPIERKVTEVFQEILPGFSYREFADALEIDLGP